LTARRTAARNTGIPTLFAAALGRRTLDIKAVAIATRGKIITAFLRCEFMSVACGNAQRLNRPRNRRKYH